jgi:hypothetical protein
MQYCVYGYRAEMTTKMTYGHKICIQSGFEEKKVTVVHGKNRLCPSNATLETTAKKTYCRGV